MSSSPDEKPTRWQRLKQHGAFQAGFIFASAAWLALQAADIFGLSTTVVRLLGLVLFGGFAVLTVYAWVSTGKTSERAGTPRRGRVRARAVVAAAVALLLLGASAWWLRPNLFGAVRPGADVIAVLPFSTSGATVAVLGEGLVDLLSTNLNEVGAIRTVDPRTSMHRWRQVARNGSVDLAGALRIGNDVGAGSVLWGSVVEVGGEVRLAADLIGVDGKTLARVEASGKADSVLVLVDQLSIKVLSEIWRSREPLPAFRLSAITTQSPAALRAYLRGEQFFRRLKYDSARTSFERAIAEDSTFALAQYRLGESYGWTEGLGSAAAQRYSEAAERFNYRLPTRERALVVAHRLHEQGDFAAHDSLRAFIERYPDDAAGWYLLADAQFHSVHLLDISLEEVFAGFDRVLELDPSFAPAIQHPIELSLSVGDSARFQRYVGLLAAGESERDVAYYRSIAAVRWGPREQRLAEFTAAVQGRKLPGDVNRLLRVYIDATFDDETIDFESIRAAFDTTRAAFPGNTQLRMGFSLIEAVTAASLGRFRIVEAILDTVRARVPEMAYAVSMPLIMAGVGPPGFGEPELKRLESAGPPATAPVAAYWRTNIAFARGDLARARDILRGVPADSGGPVPPAVWDVARAWLQLEQNDSLGAARDALAAMRRAGYAPPVLNLTQVNRFFISRIDASRPETRDRAVNYIRYGIAMEPTTPLLFAIPIAETLEIAGHPEEAARILARFVALWSNADPEVQPHVETARRMLTRLTAERNRSRT